MSQEPQTQTKKNESKLLDERYSIINGAQVSALYHQKRERFFDLMDKNITAIAIISSSSAIASISHPWVMAFFSLVIAITSTFSLVFGFSDKAKKHADLAKRYKLLLADIYIQHIDELTQPLINSWQEAFYRIEAEEPPSLGALVIICQNELAAASGHDDYIVPLTKSQKILAHFFDFNVEDNVKQMPYKKKSKSE